MYKQKGIFGTKIDFFLVHAYKYTTALKKFRAAKPKGIALNIYVEYNKK